VKVKYVDEVGQEIAPEDTLTGNIGDQYQTQAKQVAGYVLKETPSNATGTYKEGTQTVTYVYQPDFLIGVLPFKKDINQAVVGFRNNTDQPIPLYIKINNTKESLPTIQSIKILGLNDSDVEFVQTQTPLQSTITPIKNGKVFEVMPGRVELVYINYDKKTLNKLPRENYTTKFSWGTKNGDELTFKEEENYFGYPPKQGTVKVKYVNETGQEIASEDTLIGNVGDQYQTQAKQVAGYVLKETPSNATGTYKEGTQTVTYVYKRQQGTVKVKYVDEVGQEIAPEDTLTGNVGDQYQTQVKQVAGYVLKETPSNATGTYKEGTQTVTYVYQKEPDYYLSIPKSIIFTDEQDSSDASVKIFNKDGSDYTGNSDLQVNVVSANKFNLVDSKTNKTVQYSLNYQNNTINNQNNLVGVLSKNSVKINGIARLLKKDTSNKKYNYTDTLTYEFTLK
ncbi:MucBP domain-containing protein, partial [Enterococcus faecalis]|nr:MucBP domain-containing protein [Enterococcus faecalis]EGO5066837.1 MucBP domain-containing protein [Enterococcus faecalis]